ncbi:hypothetical protein [Xanthobacter flavus]|uniref:hypothetical protein n=1 Tax=Xanthobacter flavus TaxID=281 RepID=UPI003726FD8B
MTDEVKAAVVQIEEDDLRDLIRSELSEGASHRFRFDRTVNLGHLLTALIMASGLFLTYSRFDTRLVVLETQMTRQTEVLDRTIRLDERFQAVMQRLDRLERPR